MFLRGATAIIDAQGEIIAEVPDDIQRIIREILEDEEIRKGIIDIDCMPIYSEGNSVEWYFVDTETEGDDPYYIGL